MGRPRYDGSQVEEEEWIGKGRGNGGGKEEVKDGNWYGGRQPQLSQRDRAMRYVSNRAMFHDV